MPGSDPHSTAETPGYEPLVPLPYALYCLNGGIWGLLQGGTPRTVQPIVWKRLKPAAQDAVPLLASDRDPVLEEAKRDELYSAILDLCREFGYTNEHTCDCIQQVVNSVSFHPFEE